MSKRKHFCGFDSLFCGHCLGRNISNFGLLHLYKKKRWEIQKVLAMVKSLLRACSQSLAGPTGSPGLLAASCAGAGGLPALWRLGTGCPSTFSLLGVELRVRQVRPHSLPCLESLGGHTCCPCSTSSTGTLPPTQT